MHTVRHRFLFCTFLFAALYSACGDSAPQDAGNKIVNWWHFWAEPYQKPIVRKLISDFERSNPGIKIKATELTWSSGYEKLTAAFAGDHPPDVLELGSDWIYEFGSRGLLEDLSQTTDSLKSHYLGWSCAEVDGKVFAMPWLLGSRILFINKGLVPMADEIVNLETLKEYICAAHHPEKQIYGFGNTKREPHQLYKKFLPFLWTFGGNILSSDGTKVILDSPESVQALSYYLDLCRCGLLESQKNLDDSFVAGNLAVVFSGGWLIRKIQEQHPGLNYTVLPMPSPTPGIPGTSFFGGEYLAVSRKSTVTKESLRWIRFLMSEENSMALCAESKVVVPSAVNAIELPYYKTHPLERTLFQQIQYSRSSPLHPKWNVIEGILEEMLEQVTYEKVGPREAITLAKTRIEKELAK